MHWSVSRIQCGIGTTAAAHATVIHGVPSKLSLAGASRNGKPKKASVMRRRRFLD
jgi:hypothetical protein